MEGHAMSEVTLGGKPVEVAGELPAEGTKAPSSNSSTGT